jgi:hypothetical protein
MRSLMEMLPLVPKASYLHFIFTLIQERKPTTTSEPRCTPHNSAAVVGGGHLSHAIEAR